MKRILFVLIPALLLCISTMAQTAKIKRLEIQRRKALLEIQNTNKLLIDTKKVSKNLLIRVNLISNQIESRKQVISLLEQESNALIVQQNLTQKEIESLEKELKLKQKNYEKAVNGMIYRKQSENRLLYVLSGKSLAESMRRMRFLREYSEWRCKQADEITAKTKELQQKRADLAQQHRSKVLLINQKDAEQKTLMKEEDAQRQEMTEAKQKQQELQSIIAQKRQQANQLNAEIERLIAEEVARQQREEKRKAEERAQRLAAEEKARQLAAAEKAKSETQQKGKNQKQQIKSKKRKNTTSKKAVNASETIAEKPIVRNESSLKEASSENVTLSNSFAANKGKLPVPVTGRYSIISGFGEHQQSQYVTINSNGIDIQTQAGADARATFNGEISKIVAFPGYNNCIIIRHGNYYTFYGNIQSVFVHVGQTVKTGQDIGKIFTDPDTGVTKMHFQLWKGTYKQNPSSWLRR